jgi:hypothetical protein
MTSRALDDEMIFHLARRLAGRDRTEYLDQNHSRTLRGYRDNAILGCVLIVSRLTGPAVFPTRRSESAVTFVRAAAASDRRHPVTLPSDTSSTTGTSRRCAWPRQAGANDPTGLAPSAVEPAALAATVGRGSRR